jgi:hypothetical protein
MRWKGLPDLGDFTIDMELRHWQPGKNIESPIPPEHIQRLAPRSLLPVDLNVVHNSELMGVYLSLDKFKSWITRRFKNQGIGKWEQCEFAYEDAPANKYLDHRYIVIESPSDFQHTISVLYNRSARADSTTAPTPTLYL